MRDNDPKQDTPTLGRVVKPEPAPPKPDLWLPITSQAGYQRNTVTGDVRKVLNLWEQIGLRLAEYSLETPTQRSTP